MNSWGNEIDMILKGVGNAVFIATNNRGAGLGMIVDFVLCLEKTLGFNDSSFEAYPVLAFPDSDTLI